MQARYSEFRLAGGTMPLSLRYTAIASTTRTLDSMLTSYGLPHVFEIYDGNHVNHIADRVELHVLPFFSDNLAATRGSP